MARKKKKSTLVFMPYKVSMWDCMESIWRAAIKDKRCMVYVVPVAYFEKKEDGSLKEWHYDLQDFPANINAVDYRSFIMDKVKPDIIFVHNPYNEKNRATSIDPAYYSHNLRHYAKKLVYVPYFVASKRWPYNHAWTPLYEDMDYIIVQKEDMEIAPEPGTHLEDEEKHLLSESIPEEKILPLGSPKLDRIFYCETHKRTPRKWRDIIRGRKVILYNTGMNGISEHNMMFVRKMEYIFSLFQQRNDVVLLWRPHPMIEQSLNYAHPDVREKYFELKKRFLDEKIGIYDVSHDVEMAMAHADAYLGESSSSLVGMFGYAGKPIFLIQDWLLWEEPDWKDKATLQMGMQILEKDYRYFLAFDYNMFCRMSRQTGEVEILVRFQDHPYGSGTYDCFIRGNKSHKFYFSPNRADEILVYDEAAGACQYLPYEDPLPAGNFGGIIPYGKYLYFMPNQYPGIMRLDQENNEIEYFGDFLDAELGDIEEQKRSLCGMFLYRGKEHGIYFLRAVNGRHLFFDFETGIFSWLPGGLDVELKDYGGIIEEKPGSDIFWVLPGTSAALRRWNLRTGECEVVDEYPEGYVCNDDWLTRKEGRRFSSPVRCDGYIYLLPVNGNMALRLDMARKKLEKTELGLPWKLGEYTDDNTFYLRQSPILGVGPGTRGTERALQLAMDNQIYYYDFHTGECRSEPCRLPEEVARVLPTPIKDAFGDIGNGNTPYAVRENKRCRTVSQFIDYVRDNEHDSKKQQEAWSVLVNNADGTCGQKVLEELLARLD